MLDIKPISTGINWAIIPKIIYKEFCKNGNERSFSSTRNETGEMIKTYGELLPPYYTSFNHVENGFYCLENHYECLIYDLNKGDYFDVDFNQLNEMTILPYLNEYGKGFQYGYNNFENSFKDNSNLFSRRDEDIALKIFSRIFGFLSLKVGAFSFGICIDLEKAEEIKKEKNIKFIKIVKKKNFYESGISGGEFFKAWEIILNNPLIFKPIFEENIKDFKENNETPNSNIIKPSNNYYFKIKAGASKKAKATNLFDALVYGKYVDVTSKKDFINAFMGNTPENKINWIGSFGDLKTFINHSISIGLIEKVSSKWVITSNIFNNNGISFDNNTIKDTQVTKNEKIFKNLISSIF